MAKIQMIDGVPDVEVGSLWRRPSTGIVVKVHSVQRRHRDESIGLSMPAGVRIPLTAKPEATIFWELGAWFNDWEPVKVEDVPIGSTWERHGAHDVKTVTVLRCFLLPRGGGAVSVRAGPHECDIDVETWFREWTPAKVTPPPSPPGLTPELRGQVRELIKSWKPRTGLDQMCVAEIPAATLPEPVSLAGYAAGTVVHESVRITGRYTPLHSSFNSDDVAAFCAAHSRHVADQLNANRAQSYPKVHVAKEETLLWDFAATERREHLAPLAIAFAEVAKAIEDPNAHAKIVEAAVKDRPAGVDADAYRAALIGTFAGIENRRWLGDGKTSALARCRAVVDICAWARGVMAALAGHDGDCFKLRYEAAFATSKATLPSGRWYGGKTWEPRGRFRRG